jgi:hypothetical protein
MSAEAKTTCTPAFHVECGVPLHSSDGAVLIQSPGDTAWLPLQPPTLSLSLSHTHTHTLSLSLSLSLSVCVCVCVWGGGVVCRPALQSIFNMKVLTSIP